MPKRFPTIKFLLQSQMAIVIAIAVSSTLITLKMRQHVGFEMIELQAYDRMIRWKRPLGTDDRLLMVEINETDLQTLKQVTPSDAILARAIDRLQQSKPRVIGVDLYRDLPQGKGQAALSKAFKQIGRAHV